jgi:hypothetical protein
MAPTDARLWWGLCDRQNHNGGSSHSNQRDSGVRFTLVQQPILSRTSPLVKTSTVPFIGNTSTDLTSHQSPPSLSTTTWGTKLPTYEPLVDTLNHIQPQQCHQSVTSLFQYRLT